MDEGSVTLGQAFVAGVSTAIDAVGDVFSAIVSGPWAAVLPIVGLAVGFFVCRVGIRIVKSLIKGY